MTVDTKVQIQTFGIDRDREIELAKKNCIDKTVQVLPELFEKYRTAGITNIFILGTTPEWNDGEECEHGMQVLISNDRKEYKFTDIIEYFERFDADIDYENPGAEILNINIGVPHKICKDLGARVHSELFDILYHGLLTNWKLEITFLDNKVEVKHSAYRCGY
jgi:hypothetical protein